MKPKDVNRLFVLVVLFFAEIILGGMALMLAFKPATLHIETPVAGERVIEQPATTRLGMELRATVWKEYPEYTGTLGAIGIIQLLAACFLAGIIYNDYEGIKLADFDLKIEDEA